MFYTSADDFDSPVDSVSRLLDIKTEDHKGKIPEMMKSAGSDLYTSYSILNNVKNDLLWGPTKSGDDHPMSMPDADDTKDQLKRQSPLSMLSVTSGVSEGEDTTDTDSALESDDSSVNVPSNVTVTDAIRSHLLGLHSCLSHLADAATYITNKYQDEVNI